MAAIQQLAHLLRRKEKSVKVNEKDDNNEESSKDGESKKQGQQRPQTPFELTSSDETTFKRRQKTRFSRWDRYRRLRADENEQDINEKSKFRSRSLKSFFTEAAHALSASPRQLSTKRASATEANQEMAQKPTTLSSNVNSHRNSEAQPVANVVQSPQQQAQASLYLSNKSVKNKQQRDAQDVVPKFTGKASALVSPLPTSSNDGHSILTNAAHANDIWKLLHEERSAHSPFTNKNSKNLLNKKEGAGIIKESTDTSQVEENDNEIKTNSSGTNLKHENTVVDTGIMATAVVASGGIATSSVTSSPLATPTTPGLPPSARKQEIIKLTEHLVDAITSSDYSTYSKLCDAGMTCFEPESLGNLIEGLEFHKFYFDNSSIAGHSNSLKHVRSTVLNPHVHLLGDDAACIAYVRLTQWVDKSGIATSRRCEETRIWQKRDSKWHCIHFHRSASPSAVFSA